LYDIEFLGGTSVTIDLKKDRAAKFTQEDIEKRLASAHDEMKQIADKVERASVTQQGTDYDISAQGVAPDRLADIVAGQLSDQLPQGGVRDNGHGGVTVRLKDEAKFNGATPSLDLMRQQIKLAAQRTREAGEQIADSQVQAITETGSGSAKATSYEIVTR